MPICAAIITAALLSGPAGTTPADQNAAADVSPGKQIARFVMQNADQPELITNKALEFTKGRGPDIGAIMAEMGEQVPDAQAAAQRGPVARNGQTAVRFSPDSQGTGEQGPVIRTSANPGPHDIYLHPQADKPIIGKISGKDLAQQLAGQQFSESDSESRSSDDE